MMKPLFRKFRRTTSAKPLTKNRRFSHERLEPRMMMTINPMGADFLVNDFVPGFQGIEGNVSSVAVSEAGTIAAYTSLENNASESIFIRRFDQAGAAQGAAVRANSTIQGTRTGAVVAASEAGLSVVVWQGRGAGDKYGIFLQRFDVDGVAVGGEQLVNETIGGKQHDPSLGMAGDGSFVVTWSGPSGSDPAGVFARRFNADGTPIAGQELVNTTTASDQGESDVAVNKQGDYVITWSSRNQDGDDWSVVGQRFNAAGERQGDEFVINTTTADSQQESSVALQDDGTFMVVWSSRGQDGDSWGVVAQRFDATGAAVGDEIIVNTTTAGHQRHAQVAGAGDKYLVTWQSGIANGSGWEVMAQGLDVSGARVGSEMTVNSLPSGANSGHQQHPAAALNADGHGAIVWSGNGATDRQGVYGQRFLDDDPALAQQAPDLATISNQTVAPNTEMSVTVTATDPNGGDTLTFQLDPTGSPANATIERIDNNSAIIRWTPTDSEQSSAVDFRVLVTDDGEPPLADSESFQVTVTDGSLTLDLNGSNEAGADTSAQFAKGSPPTLIVSEELRIVGAAGSNNMLTQATATFDATPDGSRETLRANITGTNIFAVYVSSSRRLELSGVDTVENYERVLRTLRYRNTSDNPTGERTVTVQVGDASEMSNVASISLTVGTADLVDFAQELAASGAKFFGAAWCPACTAQKELFEDGGQFLPFAEVTNPDRTTNQVGIDNNINAFPTWVFADGTRLEGMQSLQTLSQRSGVAIPVSDDPFIAPIANDTLLIGSPLHVPLDGYDLNGGPLTYTVTTSNPDVTPTILSGNSSARVNVAGYGDLVFELFEGRASRATDQFIELANDDFYNDVIFHRVINDFVIQGGDPTGTGSGGSTLGDFDDHFHVDLQHNRTGLLSYAKTTDDTNDSQFFITEHTDAGSISNLRNLDFNHSVFGILVEGEANRTAISDTAVSSADRPINEIKMENVEIFDDVENAVLMLKAEPGTTGDVTVTVTAKDQQGNTFDRTFTVTVEEDTFNGRPFLGDITPPTIAMNTSAEITLTATDVEGDDFVFSTIRLGSVDYTLDLSDAGVLTVTPPTDFVGTMEVEVRVARSAGASDFDSQVINIEVT